jgi:hypothetical protein
LSRAWAAAAGSVSGGRRAYKMAVWKWLEVIR